MNSPDRSGTVSIITPEKTEAIPDVIADTPEDLKTLMAKEKRTKRAGRSFLTSARNLASLSLGNVKKKPAISTARMKNSRSLEEALKDPSVSGYKASNVQMNAAMSVSTGLSVAQVLNYCFKYFYLLFFKMLIFSEVVIFFKKFDLYQWLPFHVG